MLDGQLHLLYRFERRYFRRHDALVNRFVPVRAMFLITGTSHNGESTRGSLVEQANDISGLE